MNSKLILKLKIPLDYQEGDINNPTLVMVAVLGAIASYQQQWLYYQYEKQVHKTRILT
jgi:hypothetical protein